MAQQVNNNDAIERRKQFVTTEMQKMKQQFLNVQNIFTQNEISMVTTQELGESFASFFNDGSEMTSYYEGIKRDMTANQKIIQKNRKILANL